ncbi:MAG: hypothetical protein RI914_296 [Pseudomonadota bacterium]
MPRNPHPPAQRPSAPVESTTLVPTPGASAASAAAKAHDWQLRRLNQILGQRQTLEAVGQAHRQVRHDILNPLQERHRQAMRALALSLDASLVAKQLSGAQRDTAQQRLCAMAQLLARAGDAEMVVLHDRYHPLSWAELERERREAWQADHQAAAAQAEAQAQRKAASQARQQRKAPAQAQAADLAQQRLRSLFRQLASALHPDREPDPERRLVKTALMSEANAAHERRDWLALLDIQQRAAISTPASPASDAQLAEVTVLLKQQVADQERQRAALNDRFADEFGLSPGTGVTAERLAAALSQQVQLLQAKVDQLEAAALQVQGTAALKRWLKD